MRGNSAQQISCVEEYLAFEVTRAPENNKTADPSVVWADVQKYVKTGTRLYTSAGTDILGNNFTLPTWEVDREWQRPYQRFDRKVVDITQEDI